MSIEIKKCCAKNGDTIEGLFEIQPKIFYDNRGYFFESYNEREFFSSGLKMKFVQDNQSCSKKNILRGLHFQKNHPQGKLVRVLSGKVFDVAVDLRNDSKTFGMYCGLILDSEKQNQFYIPEGFAHGFYVLSESAIFSYKCTDFYYPDDEDGLLWNDENLKIQWPTIDKIFNPILAEKDKLYPAFDKNKIYF